MRQRYPGARIWAIFEPRSNTTRRNIFQNELAEALAAADRVVISEVEDPGKVAEAERLDPTALVKGAARFRRGGLARAGRGCHRGQGLPVGPAG